MRLPAALFWFVLSAWTAPAIAQNPIHRCIGANGNPVFTDQPCEAMHATSVTAPQKPVGDAVGLTPMPLMCAHLLPQLRQSVIDAFANHDANRLAGLMLWHGYGRGAAVADIRSLASIMRRPLLDLNPSIDPDDPGRNDGPAMPSSTLAPATQLVLHVAGNGSSEAPLALRFDIVHRSGCLWLRRVD